MTEASNVTYVKDGDGVATITLNRPEKLNAFTFQMISDWFGHLKAAESDPDVRVVVLTGAGRGFCAGADVDEISQRSKEASTLNRKDFLWRHLHKLALLVERMEKPLIGAINGIARGAGCDLASMCDIRIAGESASFGWSYIKLNIIAGSGGTYYLPRIIGMDRALELFWTGRTVSAQEAASMGLVTRVVPDDALQTTTHELARQIAAQPADAVQFYRRAAYQGADQSLYSHLDMLSSHISVLGTSRENSQRVEAFRGGRKKSDS